MSLGITQASAAMNNNDNSCRSQGQDAIVTTNAPTTMEFRISNREDICSGGFEIIARHGDINQYLLASPMELGLRANAQVFLLKTSSNTALLIGELPMTADYTGNLRFIDTFQEGGSIFQNRYSINASNVTRHPQSLELAFEGTICVRSVSGVYRMDISPTQKCEQKVQATRRKPICILHNSTRAYIAPGAKCKALQSFIE